MTFIVLYVLFGILLFAASIYGVTHFDNDDVELSYVLGFLILSFSPPVNLLWAACIAEEFIKHSKSRFFRWTFNPVIFRRKIK